MASHRTLSRPKSVASLIAAAAIAVACGSSEDSLFQDPSLTGGDAGDNGSSGSSGGSSGIFTGDDSGASSSSGGDGDGGLNACATETKKAERIPLDLYFMVDTSGSMSQTVAGGGTKWEAVRTALKQFVADPKSAGLGVGLQYFPKINNVNAPTKCGTDAACNGFGPCINNKACEALGPGNTIILCKTSADCPGNAPCSDFGRCPGTQYSCVKNFASCPIGVQCSYFDYSYCTGRDSCTATDYAGPSVPFGALPGAQVALTTSLDARTVDGLTPTSAALTGALDAAKAQAVANPTHAVIAVFVTDGFPTECTTQDIPGVAAIAQAGVMGTPSVKTFVIGVFTDTEKAQATTNLNQIAAAGGTTSAFVISTSANVTQQFQAALDAIRGSSLPCEYTLPKPTTGTPDYEKVNVQLTSGAGAKSLLPYATSAAACGNGPGWYYDNDPKNGGTPTKVIICPSSCSALNGDPNAQMDVLLGCKTVTRVPK